VSFSLKIDFFLLFIKEIKLTILFQVNIGKKKINFKCEKEKCLQYPKNLLTVI